jgi:hypothetical protein
MLSLGNKLSLTTQPIYKFVNEHSVDFDGVDDRIITDGEVVQYQHATYSFWCKASETGQNTGVFGHGSINIGAFHFNAFGNNKPIIYLENNYYRYWDDTSAQDDGEWHHWAVYVDINDITNCKLYVDGVLQNPSTTVSTGSANPYTESLTIGSDQASGGNSFVGKLDEFAVYDRELTQAEITRMYNTYYSPNRVANGNFAQEGVEEVTNGDFSQEGSQLVENNDFSNYEAASQSRLVGGVQFDDWNENPLNGTATFESITGGYRRTVVTPANAGSAWQQRVYQEVSSDLTVGKHYRFTATFLTSDGSNFYARISKLTSLDLQAGGEYTTVANTPRSIDIIFKCTANTDQYIDLWAKDVQSVDSFVEVSNISLKEVLQDWTVADYGGTAASASLSLDNGAVKILKTADSDWRSSFLRQTITYTSTKFYKVSFKIKDGNTTGANIYVRHDYDTGSRTIASGISLTSSFVEYTYYFQAESNSTDISFGNLSWNSAGSGEYFFVDDITIKEVGQNWTFGTGWSTDGTKAVSDGSQTGNSWLSQSGKLTSGSTYKITFDLVVNSGQVVVDSYSSPAALTSTNSYELNVTASTTTFQFMANSTFTGSVDNIVVQELKHDATNLMLNAGAYQSANPLITSTKSMEFDGVDDRLMVNSVLGSLTGSVIFWINRDNNTGYQYLFDARGSGSGTGFAYFDTGTDNLVVSSGTRYVDGVAATSVPTDGKWHNIIITGVTLDVDESIRYGTDYGNGNALDGKMTEVGLWDRTLTALEVASLYNQGVPTNLLVSRGDYVATGLQGYWKMGDGTNDEYPYIFDQTNPTYSSDLISTLQNGRTGGTNAFEEFTDNGGGSYTFGSTSTNWAGTEQPDADTFAIEVGEIYKFTFDYTLNSGSSSFGLSIGNTAVGSSYAGGYYYPSYNGSHTVYFTIQTANSSSRIISQTNAIQNFTISNLVLQKLEGNIATMTNMVEGNISNQYPLTKIRNYYRMGDGIMDGYPIIQDQTSPNLAHIPTTNLFLNSEPTTSEGAAANVSYGSFDWGILDFTNAIIFGDNSVLRLWYGATLSASTEYTISAFVKMDDLSEPTVSTSSSSGDFSFVTGGDITGTINANKYMGNNIWRVSKTDTSSSSTLTDSGIIKYTGQSSKSFKIVGLQIEQQSQATGYIKSDGIAAVRKSSTTNLITYSEDFTQSAWTKNDVTITSNSTTAPNSTLTADKITKDGVSANDRIKVDDATISNSTVYNISAYVKNNDVVVGGRTTIAVRISGGTLFRKTYEWNGSALSFASNFDSGTKTNEILENVGNGWYRIGFSFTSDGTVADIELDVDRQNASDTTSLFAWGFQLEEQTQAETYAKTTGLPVTIDLFTENNYGTMTNMSASDIVEDTP